jgi:hypothetical protein
MKPKTDPKEFKKWLTWLPEEKRDKLTLIPLQPMSKVPDVPRGESWQNPLYHLVPEAALDRLEIGKNVGVVATKGTLAFLDIERKNIRKVNDYLPKKIIDTLIVKTRDGGLHLDYENLGLPNKDLRVNGTQLIELRADNRYVVAPGSFVPPDEGSKGTGLYHVVNERAPLPLHASDLPWLNEQVEPSQHPKEPVNFDGEFMVLPCIQVLFTVKLDHNRQDRAAKILSIAWCQDNPGNLDGFVAVAQSFAGFQSRPDSKVNPRNVISWARSVGQSKRRWNCGEAINLLRDNGVYPPCGSCQMKVEVKS